MQNTVTASHACLWGPPAISSSAAAPSNPSPRALLLPTSSSSFSPPFQLPDRELRSASQLTFKGDMSHRQHVFSSHDLFSPQSALWNLVPKISSGLMQLKSCFSFKKTQTQTTTTKKTQTKNSPLWSICRKKKKKNPKATTTTTKNPSNNRKRYGTVSWQWILNSCKVVSWIKCHSST